MRGQRRAWKTHHFWHKVVDRCRAEPSHTLSEFTFQYLDYFRHPGFSVGLEKEHRKSTHVRRRDKQTDTLGV